MRKAVQTPSDSSLSTTASANFEDPLALGKQLVELIERLIDEANPETERVCVEFGMTAFFSDPDPALSRSHNKKVPMVKSISASKQPIKSLASPKSLKTISPNITTDSTRNRKSNLVKCRMSSDTHKIATGCTEELVRTKSFDDKCCDNHFTNEISDSYDKNVETKNPNPELIKKRPRSLKIRKTNKRSSERKILKNKRQRSPDGENSEWLDID